MKKAFIDLSKIVVYDFDSGQTSSNFSGGAKN